MEEAGRAALLVEDDGQDLPAHGFQKVDRVIEEYVYNVRSDGGKMRYVLCVVTAGLLLVSGPLGCARSRTNTVKTEERVQRPGARADTEVRVSKETTMTTVTQVPQESRGVLSTAISFLGEVISWPFRVVGSLFRALF